MSPPAKKRGAVAGLKQALNSKHHVMIVFIGSPASGKTSLEDQLIQQWQAANRPVKVLDPQHQFADARYKGVSEWPGIHDVDAWMQNLIDSKWHGLLVLEEADMYLHAAARSVWREVFASFRHLGLDIIVNTRRGQDIPKHVISNASYYAIFRTRGTRAKQSVRDAIGDDHPEIMKQIPQEPFLYVFAEADSGDFSVMKTKKRQVITTADLKKDRYS